MYHVSAQGVDERMINVHYYYHYFIWKGNNESNAVVQISGTVREQAMYVH